MSIVGLNVAIAAITLSLRRRISFLALLRRGLGVRITAEGALISLAPIWVIGIDFSLVMAPLLAITSILVFRSTRQALERAHEAHHDSLDRPRQPAGVHGSAQRRPRRPAHRTPNHGAADGPQRLQGDQRSPRPRDRRRLAGGIRRAARAQPAGGDRLCPARRRRVRGARASRRSTPWRSAGEIAALHNALSAPLDIEGFPLTVGVSIGVATAPEDGRTGPDLLRAADVAMYKAKRCRTPIEFYDNCVKSPQRGRLSLLSDLSDALDRPPAAHPLPAAVAHDRRSRRHRRGADPVAAPRPRLDPAQRVHRRRRTDRPDRTDHRARAAGGDGRHDHRQRRRREARRQRVGPQPAGRELRRRGVERARASRVSRRTDSSSRSPSGRS